MGAFLVKLVVTAATFAAGLFFLPIVLPEMRVRGVEDGLKAGIVGGVLSATLGRLLWYVLCLLFFPLALLGPIGAFLVQAVVNLGLLLAAAHVFEGIEFKRWMTAVWAAVALTALQTLVALAGG